MSAGAWRRRGALFALALAAARASAEPPFPADPPPNRGEYEAFRRGRAELLEPNYLPFLVHPVTTPSGVALVLCRWDAADLPLAVAIDVPTIPDDLQDEFDPKSPATYRAAVERALAEWQDALEGLVRFRRVSDPRRARLRVRLLAEAAPTPAPDVLVLGATPVEGACRATGRDAPGRLGVRYAAPEVRVYLADRSGLLTPDQVQRVALHELGHALGMRGHSPVSTDLMAADWREAPVARLSAEDVNSLLDLYRLPNGTLYRAAGAVPPSRPAARPPPGPPRLAAAPAVDARNGFSLRLPEGWTRIETPRGIAALDGPTWDHAAALDLAMRPAPSLEAFLERGGAAPLAGERAEEGRRERVAGRPTLRVRTQDPAAGIVRTRLFVEAKPGSVLVVTASAPAAAEAEYGPWFEASLATLRLELGTEPSSPTPRRVGP